jgi:anti-sigma B factor antagonist
MMEISHTEVAPGTVVVSLTGRVMMGAASEEIVTVVESLLRQGKRTVVFDLSAITAIDSTGIGRFISSYNKIAAAGGDMRMAGATGHIFDAFHVSLLDTVFSFYDNLAEAQRP